MPLQMRGPSFGNLDETWHKDSSLLACVTRWKKASFVAHLSWVWHEKDHHFLPVAFIWERLPDAVTWATSFFPHRILSLKEEKIQGTCVCQQEPNKQMHVKKVTTATPMPCCRFNARGQVKQLLSRGFISCVLFSQGKGDLRKNISFAQFISTCESVEKLTMTYLFQFLVKRC